MSLNIQLEKEYQYSNNSGLDSEWLEDFQEYLLAISNGNSPTNIYNIEEAIFGVEALLNFTYSNSETNSSGFYTDIIEFNIPASTNWFDFYNFANDRTNTEIDTNETGVVQLSSVDIRYVDIVDGEFILSLSYYFEEVNSNDPYNSPFTEGGSPDCEVWDEDEMFVLGWMDNDIHPVTDCNYCERPEDVEETVFGAIENYMNTILPVNPCAENEVIKIIDVNSNEKGLADHPFHWGDCYDFSEPITFYFADCFDGDRANCILCEIFDTIDANDSLRFSIPEGYSLLSLDISIDFVPSGDNECERTTIIIFNYTYGKIICAYKCIGCPTYTNPLEIEIPPFCC